MTTGILANNSKAESEATDVSNRQSFKLAMVVYVYALRRLNVLVSRSFDLDSTGLTLRGLQGRNHGFSRTIHLRRDFNCAIGCREV